MQIVPDESPSGKPVEAPPGARGSRARALLADALEAVTDYANTIQRSHEPRERGAAAHRAGQAVITLAAYAEELEERIAAARDAQDWSGLA